MEIFMTHAVHGATHVYSEREAEYNEKNGWMRGAQPKPVEDTGKNGRPILKVAPPGAAKHGNPEGLGASRRDL